MFRRLALLALLIGSPAWGVDTIRVLTTLPDLADWTRELGGRRVEVRSLLTGTENYHSYEPRVSDVKAVARTRVLVKVGLGLEEWLDGLVENARNSQLLTVEAARGVEVLGAGEPAGGPAGAHDHDHALGNPHVWVDPVSAGIMCRNIARGLEAADPFAGDFYQKRLRAYLDRLEATTARLRAEVAALPDRRFLSYHAAWPYFARGLGFELAGVVTELPGQEPSARSLAALIERIRAEKIRVLVTEPQLPSKLPEVLAHETGIRVISLSHLLVAGSAPNYLALLEKNAGALISALKEPRR
ncbi:MAG: metal ABC transporter substrate-binding protein [Deferrisomatales bacterium]